MKNTFHITGDRIELVKLLKASGLCATGGLAKVAIEEGRVRVDGRPELRKGCKIHKGQQVAFEGHIIEVG